MFAASTRFVKCEKCHHFFVVLSEVDSKKTIKEQTKDERRNSFERVPLPSPKKVISFLILLLYSSSSFQKEAKPNCSWKLCCAVPPM